MKPTLLEQAMSLPVRNTNQRVNPEEIEIALAWLEGMLSVTQIAKVMKIPSGSVQSRMSKLLRDAYQAGRLVIKEVKK